MNKQTFSQIVLKMLKRRVIFCTAESLHKKTLVPFGSVLSAADFSMLLSHTQSPGMLSNIYFAELPAICLVRASLNTGCYEQVFVGLLLLMMMRELTAQQLIPHFLCNTSQILRRHPIPHTQLLSVVTGVNEVLTIQCPENSGNQDLTLSQERAGFNHRTG